MFHTHTSKKRAKAIALILFLLGLAIISYLGVWWPGIMLVVGIPLAVRQYLLGHFYDVGVTLIVFVGIFFIDLFNISGRYLLPVLFTLGAIYIFFRDYLESTTPSEAEREEDLNEEIEEESEKKKR
jgi:hypothetical protein